MSGLCGWLGGSADAATARQALAGMAAELCRGALDLPVRGSEVQAGAALALRAPARAGSWWVDGRLLAAVDGAPRWIEPALSAEARATGHAAVLAQAYRRWGKGLLDRLDGAFALALIDAEAQEALVAIDRFGVGTFCYGVAEDGAVVFGSTTDSVYRYPWMPASLSEQALYTFFYFVDRIPAPLTIYREQKKLEPGQCLFIRSGHLDVVTYGRAPSRPRDPKDKRQLRDELRNRVRAAIEKSVDGENVATIGAFLSGGLDSGTIAGVLSALFARPLPTFFVGFPVDGFDESEYARIVSERFRTEHHETTVSPEDLFAAFERCITHFDEPFGNSSAIPSYFCARAAANRGIEVMIAGDGGDELFAGNARYLKDDMFDHWKRLPEFLRRRVIGPLLDVFPEDTAYRVLRRAKSYAEWASRGVVERYVGDNIFRRESVSEIFRPDFLRAVAIREPLALAERFYKAAPSPAKLHGMMSVDRHLALAASDLRKVRRTGEAAGVRVKFPFLDDELAAFAWSIPVEILCPRDNLRGLFKESMADFLPSETLAKKKHGFAMPDLEYVYAHPPLREFFCDNLNSLRRRPFFTAGFVDRLIAGVRNGVIVGVIWDAVVLEVWLDSRSRPSAGMSREMVH